MRYLTKNADERDDANLLSDEVGDQQNDDEDMNEQIIKAETAQARIASRETMDKGSSHGKERERWQIRAFSSRGIGVSWRYEPPLAHRSRIWIGKRAATELLSLHQKSRKALNTEPQAADKIRGANSAGPFTPLPAIAGYAGESRGSASQPSSRSS